MAHTVLAGDPAPLLCAMLYTLPGLSGILGIRSTSVRKLLMWLYFLVVLVSILPAIQSSLLQRFSLDIKLQEGTRILGQT